MQLGGCVRDQREALGVKRRRQKSILGGRSGGTADWFDVAGKHQISQELLQGVDWMDRRAMIGNDVCKRKGQIFKEKDSGFWFGMLGLR